MHKFEGFIHRNIQPIMEKWLSEGYIVTLLGARQTGKTTLLKKLREKSRGGIFYYLLDSVMTASRIESDPGYLHHDLEERLGMSIQRFQGEINVFLDEVQKVPQVFEQVKIWHDTYPGKFKILLSGSSSLEIRKRCSESLAGRAQYVYLYPLSIAETVNHLFPQAPFTLLTNLLNMDFDSIREINSSYYSHKDELEMSFKDLMVYGLLPGVRVREENKRFTYLRSIIELYLDRDIRSSGLIRELSDFHKLIEIASYEVGGLINIQELSRFVGVMAATLKNHLSILENTFIMNFLEPWTAVRDRAVKSRKWYFFETGVPNYISGRLNFQNIFGSRVYGGLLENILLVSALSIFRNEIAPWKTYYWRNYQGREIDLVLERGEDIIPIEITASTEAEKRKIDNLSFFLEKNPSVKKAFLVYRGRLGEMKIRKTSVILLPWYLWQ